MRASADGRAARVAAAAALLAAAVAVQLFRQAGEPSWRTIWAEDGWQFLQDALRRPFADVAFEGVAGYAHLAPRLLAAAIEPLPVSAWPLAIVLVCAVATALLALYVYLASAAVIPPWPRRALLALAVVLLPVAVQEAALNMANLRLYLVFAALIAFLDLRPTRSRLAAGVAVVVLATLSDPLSLLLAPLAAWRAVSLRGRADAILSGAFALAAAGQLWVIVQSPDPEWADPGVRRETVSLYGYRVLAELLFGERFYADVVGGLGGRATLVVVFLLLTAVVALRWLRQTKGERATVAVFLAASAVAWAAPLAQRGVGVLLPVLEADGSANLSSPRYSVIPMLCLIASLLVPATRAHARSRALALVALLAACWLVALVGINYRWTTPRSPSPAFQSWLPGLEAECRGDPDAEAVIPIHPTPQTGPWQIVVPCGRLVEGRAAT